MTVVKEDETAAAEENDQLEVMTDSKLPDDWSIIGSKSVDNEGSDGESVEVISREEERVEDLSEGTQSSQDTQSLVPLETHDKSIQTVNTTSYRELMLTYHGMVLFSVICHLLIALLYLSVTNSSYQLRNTEAGELPTNLPPGLVELIEDWQQTSPRSAENKAMIISFLNHHFPLATFNEQIKSLLEKDIGKEPTLASIQKPMHYHSSSPSFKYEGSKKHPSYQDTVDKEVNRFSDEDKDSCQNCDSGNCKTFCKHGKRKGVKYYFGKVVSSVFKKFPKFNNRKS